MHDHGMSPWKHLRMMAIGAALLLGAFVLFGVPFVTALRYALLLVCPLMMGLMMLTMGGHGAAGASQRPISHDESDDPLRPDARR